MQHALDRARPALCQASVWYPGATRDGAHYGFSRHYGFGPEDASVGAHRLADLVAGAAARSCRSIILSSEYLSLDRPKAADRLIADLDDLGAQVGFVMFSRDPLDWARSLFNQYLRTVTDANAPRDLNAFVDQITANRAGDIARRFEMWRTRMGQHRLHHFRIGTGRAPEDVLGPFEEFAGRAIQGPPAGRNNQSVSAGALFRIAALLCEPPSHQRDRELANLRSGQSGAPAAPPEFLTLDAARAQRFQEQIAQPYEALPWRALPKRVPNPEPTLAL